MDQGMNRGAPSPEKSYDGSAPARRRLLSAVMAVLVASMRSETRLPKLDEASIDCLVRTASALALGDPNLRALHALLLVHAGFVASAEARASGDPHPLSRAVLAWCAYASGDDRWHDLAQEAMRSGHNEACAIARVMLDATPDASPAVVCGDALMATRDYLLFHCRC